MGLKHVALLVETSREYGRGLLRGIIRYKEEHGPWSVYFKPQGLGDPPPPWLKSWKGDGILVRINDQRMAETVLKTGVPFVDLRVVQIADLGPRLYVGVDNEAVVRLGIQHFLDRGFRHFAFCGTPRGENRYQDERSDRFYELVTAQGFSCEISSNVPNSKPLSWEEEQNSLAKWLRDLPKPVAVMTCHDDRGLQVLDACQRAGLQVPDQVAILGVDNDPFLCSLSTPPLSSIELNPERIGYEAAELLDRMMRGRPLPDQPIRIGPRRVVTRQSTDVMAVSDPDVVQAVRLIRENSYKNVNVCNLLESIPISQTSLYRRFKHHLGRTPKEEMTRVRLERAKQLLAETSLPIQNIAERIGYAEAKYFIEVFHAAEGVTPLRFRRRANGSK
jgi:LacI family transcriptional regulator